MARLSALLVLLFMVVVGAAVLQLLHAFFAAGYTHLILILYLLLDACIVNKHLPAIITRSMAVIDHRYCKMLD